MFSAAVYPVKGHKEERGKKAAEILQHFLRTMWSSQLSLQ